MKFNLDRPATTHIVRSYAPGLIQAYFPFAIVCAFLVAFFPILSNMVQGLKSVDHNLLNLFDLYGASRWQMLAKVQVALMVQVQAQ